MKALLLTDADLALLIVATRLRCEAAEDNGETGDARRWRRLLAKLERMSA